MKIVCLCENTSCCEQFGCEHGLSLYIETDRHKILFDAGQSDVFYQNARRLGIDLSAVDIAILSHGHYDHGGGMGLFLTVNDRAKLYLSQNAFDGHYSGTQRYIGLDRELAGSDRLVLCGDYVKLDAGLELFSQNGAERTVPTDSAGLTVKREDGFVPDNFTHEQYLKITQQGRTYLISGCSHKGILNIMNWFEPDVLVGGFHLMKQEPSPDDPVLCRTARELNRHKALYYTCHCTGQEQFAVLKEKMDDRLFYLCAGQTLSFD